MTKRIVLAMVLLSIGPLQNSVRAGALGPLVLPTPSILAVMAANHIPTAGCTATALHCFASTGAPIPGFGASGFTSYFPLTSQIGTPSDAARKALRFE